MATLWNTKKGTFLLASLVGGTLVAAGILIGSQFSQSESTLPFPETLLNAATAANGESLCAVTGSIDGDMEGLYTIDALSGDLQCFVMYNRGPFAGKFGGLFKTNVLEDLAVDRTQKSSYLLVTGGASFLRGTAPASRPGLSVVYVIEQNTGNFASYGLNWNANAVQAGQPQGGPFILLDKKCARTAGIRN